MITDNVCLYQVTNNRNDKTGRLCVDNHKFLAVDSIDGDFTMNGVLGLAPGDVQESFVMNLYKQGKIPSPLVGLNFEYPEDVD